MDIKNAVSNLSRTVSHSLNISTSPEAGRQGSQELSFKSLLSSGARSDLHRSQTIEAAARQLKPFAQEEIKILLLENVNEAGQQILRDQGYQVEAVKGALQEDELIEKLKYVHA